MLNLSSNKPVAATLLLVPADGRNPVKLKHEVSYA